MPCREEIRRCRGVGEGETAREGPFHYFLFTEALCQLLAFCEEAFVSCSQRFPQPGGRDQMRKINAHKDRVGVTKHRYSKSHGQRWGKGVRGEGYRFIGWSMGEL